MKNRLTKLVAFVMMLLLTVSLSVVMASANTVTKDEVIFDSVESGESGGSAWGSDDYEATTPCEHNWEVWEDGTRSCTSCGLTEKGEISGGDSWGEGTAEPDVPGEDFSCDHWDSDGDGRCNYCDAYIGSGEGSYDSNEIAYIDLSYLPEIYVGDSVNYILKICRTPNLDDERIEFNSHYFLVYNEEKEDFEEAEVFDDAHNYLYWLEVVVAEDVYFREDLKVNSRHNFFDIGYDEESNIWIICLEVFPVIDCKHNNVDEKNYCHDCNTYIGGGEVVGPEEPGVDCFEHEWIVFEDGHSKCVNCGLIIAPEEPGCDHYDYDGDGLCDNCKEYMGGGDSTCYDHYDYDGDGWCDNCKEPMGSEDKDNFIDEITIRNIPTIKVGQTAAEAIAIASTELSIEIRYVEGVSITIEEMYFIDDNDFLFNGVFEEDREYYLIVALAITGDARFSDYVCVYYREWYDFFEFDGKTLNVEIHFTPEVPDVEIGNVNIGGIIDVKENTTVGDLINTWFGPVISTDYGSVNGSNTTFEEGDEPDYGETDEPTIEENPVVKDEIPEINLDMTTFALDYNGGSFEDMYKSVASYMGCFVIFTEDGDFNFLGKNDIFVKGEKYGYMLVIIPNEGYAFSEYCEVSVTYNNSGASRGEPTVKVEDGCLYILVELNMHLCEFGWMSDANSHWIGCTCGEIAEDNQYAKHADTDSNKVCDVCKEDLSNIFDINVINGYVYSVNGEYGVSNAKPGDEVSIYISYSATQQFIRWTVEGIELPIKDLTNEYIRFIMPANDVTLTAHFVPVYIYNVELNMSGYEEGNKVGDVNVTVPENADYIISKVEFIKFYVVDGKGDEELLESDDEFLPRITYGVKITLNAKDGLIFYEDYLTAYLNNKLAMFTAFEEEDGFAICFVLPQLDKSAEKVEEINVTMTGYEIGSDTVTVELSEGLEFYSTEGLVLGYVIMDMYSGDIIEKGKKIEANREYVLIVTVKAKEGYVLGEIPASNVTLNGASLMSFRTIDPMMEDSTLDSCTIGAAMFMLPVLTDDKEGGEELETIHKIDFVTDKIEVGKPISSVNVWVDNTSSAAGKLYPELEWVWLNKPNLSEMDTSMGNFSYRKYYLFVALMPEEGYGIAPDITCADITLNGEAAYDIIYQSGMQIVIFEIDFTDGMPEHEHTGGTATCYAKAVCNICSMEYGAYAAHNLGELIAEIPGNCREKGMKAHKTCKDCFRYFDEDGKVINSIDDLKTDYDYSNHVFDEDSWHEAVPGTCSSEGMKAHWECSLCYTLFEEDKTTVLYYDDLFTGFDYDVHTVYEVDYFEEVPATCSSYGQKAHYYCYECWSLVDTDGKTVTEEDLIIELNPDVHEYIERVEGYSATCSNTGMKEHSFCYGCKTYFDTEGKVVSYEELELASDPDAHVGGVANCMHKAQCEECGEEYGDFGEHDFYMYEASAPTCAWEGKPAYGICMNCKTYCDAEGNEISEEEWEKLLIPIDPDAHNYGEWQEEVPANCINSGTKAHKSCSYCGRAFDADGKEIKDIYLYDYDNHDMSTEWIKNADEHFYICNRGCGHTSEVVKHTPNIESATETESQICTECGYVIAAMTGHECIEGNFTYIEEKESTCTEYGYTYYFECACGKYYYLDAETKEFIEIYDVDVWKLGEGLIDKKEHSYEYVEWVDEIHEKDELAPRVDAHYICSECKGYFTSWYEETTLEDLTGPMPEHYFDYDYLVDYDKTNHWLKCWCGFETEPEKHSGGTVTCNTLAVCEKCGNEYGEYSNEHNPGEDDGDCTTPIWCVDCDRIAVPGNRHHTPGEDDGDCKTAVTCKNCDKVFTEAKEDHEENEDDGDCTTAVTCKNCTTVITPAKADHEEMADDGDCTTAVTCMYCDKVFVEAKAEHKALANADDCTKSVKCDSCDTMIPGKAGHEYADDGDCTTAVICKNCTTVVTPATAHVPGDDDGDCTTAIKCKNCEKEAVPATAHVPEDDDGDCKTAVKCENCDKNAIEAKADHKANADDGDCTTAVTCEYCTTVLTPAKAHVPGDDDGDCTTAIKCANCDKMATDAKEKHEPGDDDGDCTTAVKCVNCDKNAIEAEANHVPGEDDGDCKTAVKCVNCDKMAIEAREEHKAKADDGDCITAVICEYCDQTVIPAKSNHEISEDDGDCTTAVKCKNCDKVLIDAKDVHERKEDDGNCTTAVTCKNCSTVLTPAKATHEPYEDDGLCTTQVTCKNCDAVITSAKSEHTYTESWQTNEEQHWKICINGGCTSVDSKANHISSGPATEAAAEKCIVCGYVITPQIGHEHSYNTQKSDEINHWMECDCGDKKDVTAHITAPDDNNCTTASVCIGCNYTVTPARADHEANPDDGNCTTAVTCKHCAQTVIEAKTHEKSDDDGNCTTAITCKNCDYIMTSANSAHEQADDDGNCTTAVTCKYCSIVMVIAKPHVPNDDDGNCTTAITCKNCPTELTPAKEKHEANADDGNCMTAVTCANCTAVITPAKSNHEANEDDGDCTTAITCKNCTTVMTDANAAHSFTETWQNDETQHWHACKNTGCTKTDVKENHISSGPATEAAANKCTVCGYVIEDQLNHDHDYKTQKNDEINHWMECDCGAKENVAAHTAAIDDNDCTTATLCSVCNYEMTPAKADHEANADDDNCTTAVTCKNCATVLTPAKADHEANADDGDCTTAETCKNCATVLIPAAGSHTGGTATCTAKATCSVCGKAYGHFALHIDSNNDGKCDVCEASMTTDEVANEESGATVIIPEGSEAVIPNGSEFNVDVLDVNTIETTVVGKIIETLGANTNTLAYYDLSILLQDTPVQPNGKILVTIPTPTAEFDSYQVVFIADDGSIEVCATTVNADGTLTFETNHFSKYAVVGVNETQQGTTNPPANTPDNTPSNTPENAPATTPENTDDEKKGLGTGALIGIIIAAVAVVAGTVVVVIVIVKKNSYKKYMPSKKKSSDEE